MKTATAQSKLFHSRLGLAQARLLLFSRRRESEPNKCEAKRINKVRTDTKGNPGNFIYFSKKFMLKLSYFVSMCSINATITFTSVMMHGTVLDIGRLEVLTIT